MTLRAATAGQFTKRENFLCVSSQSAIFINATTAHMHSNCSAIASQKTIAYRLTADAEESRCLGWVNPFTPQIDILDKPSFLTQSVMDRLSSLGAFPTQLPPIE